MGIEQLTQTLSGFDLPSINSNIIYELLPFLRSLDKVSISFIKSGFIILFTSIILSIFKYILLKIHKNLINSGKGIDTAFTVAIKKPIVILIWIIGISLAIQTINSELEIKALSMIHPLRKIGIISCIFWFSLRFINQYQRKFIARRELSKKNVDRTTVEAVTRLGKILVSIVLILYLMQDLGVNISGLLAFGGISGVAIGFAAKDLLSNFFGAMMIYLDKPFSIGDWIKSPDKEIEGIVETIGWRQTKIIAFEKHPIYVPNSLFASIVIENKTRMQNRRIKEYISLRYEDIDKVKKITDDIKEMLINHPSINKKQIMLVNFEKFNDYSLDILVYTFTNTIEWAKFQTVKQDVLLRIAEIIDKNGAEIAFPTSNIIYSEDKNAIIHERHVRVKPTKKMVKELKGTRSKGSMLNKGAIG